YTLIRKMPICSQLQRIGLQILCFLQIAQCMIPRGTLPAIEIRDSLQDEALGIENSGSREPVQKYLETVPHFAQQVTIFPELVQKDGLKMGFIHLTECLENFEKGKTFLTLRQYYRKSAQDILEQRNHLRAFHRLVLGRVQQKIIDSKPQAKSSHYVNKKKNAILKNRTALGKWSTPLNKISDRLMPKRNDHKRENHTDVMVIILEKAMMESLSKILLDIDSLKLKQPLKQHPSFLKLENHVFQIVAYLYKHQLITENSFRKFCDTDRVIEIAAIIMLPTFRLQYEISQIGLSKIIPNYSNFSHYRIFLLGETFNLSCKLGLFIFSLTLTFFINFIFQSINFGLEGLEPYQKRYFSYLSLEQVLNDLFLAVTRRLHFHYQIDFDRKFFGRLEKYIRAKSISKQALDTYKTCDPDYITIKRDLELLSDILMVDDPSTPKEKVAYALRSVSFFILEFLNQIYRGIIGNTGV
ncbi:hypothetical protein PSTT_09093, partial [Puccinia striiformis]